MDRASGDLAAQGSQRRGPEGPDPDSPGLGAALPGRVSRALPEVSKSSKWAPQDETHLDVPPAPFPPQGTLLSGAYEGHPAQASR